MDFPISIEELKSKPLFANFNTHEIEQFISISRLIYYPAGAFIVHEGEIKKEFFLILKGNVEIIKVDINNVEHVLARLESGDLVGEVSLIDNSPCSASARCVDNCKLLCISEVNLNKLIEKDKNFYQLIKNIAIHLCDNLREINEVTIQSFKEIIQAYQTQMKMSKMLILIIVLLSFLSFFNLMASKWIHEVVNSTLITAPLMLAIIIFLVYVFKIFDLPFKEYGITLDGWQPALKGAVIYSIPMMILTVIMKWLLIHFSSSYANLPLFVSDMEYRMGNYAYPKISWIIENVIYALLICPYQEIVSRSALQVPLQKILTGKYRVFTAIVTSNIIFMTAHVFFSPLIAFLAFVTGLFFGWLFYKYKSLVAPIVAHILIGVWGLGVVGFEIF